MRPLLTTGCSRCSPARGYRRILRPRYTSWRRKVINAFPNNLPMDDNPIQLDSTPPMQSNLILGRIIGTAVLSLLIVTGMSFSCSASRMGAPFIFKVFGFGFAIIAALMLVALYRYKPAPMRTSEPTPPPRPESLPVPTTTVIHQHFAAPPAVPKLCESCGARRKGDERSCRYCGGLL